MIATTLVAWLAFVTPLTVALVAGLALVTLLAGSRRSDTLFQLFNLQFDLIFHLVSPPLCFGIKVADDGLRFRVLADP